MWPFKLKLLNQACQASRVCCDGVPALSFVSSLAPCFPYTYTISTKVTIIPQQDDSHRPLGLCRYYSFSLQDYSPLCPPKNSSPSFKTQLSVITSMKPFLSVPGFPHLGSGVAPPLCFQPFCTRFKYVSCHNRL